MRLSYKMLLSERFLVRIDPETLKLIDKCIKENPYKWRTRSEFVRANAYRTLRENGYLPQETEVTK